MRDTRGYQNGFVGVTPKTIQRKRALTDSQLAAIVESSYDAIISKTLDGIITSWNDGAQWLYGYAAWEVVGKSISVVLPAERVDELLNIMKRIRTGQRLDRYETERVRKDGQRIHVSLSGSPISDANDAIVGA